ncbi:Nif3-like dinuclear metal center hexameric protein [bacterium]|nr:Nif3-like dinuclear metal center hexameric protein [bacterium]
MARNRSERAVAAAATIGDVVAALDVLAPPVLAESWDNVGLLVGDPEAPCSRAVVCLDVSEALVKRVAQQSGELIISHHPTLFHPLASLTGASAPERTVLAAVQCRVALVAAHTNYDVAPGGVNDVLAELLGLEDIAPLARCSASPQAKIVVFTPKAALGGVMQALSENGAGAIGQYRECSFRTEGTGAFRGLPGTDPAVGKADSFEEAAELRVEASVPLALAGRVAAAVRATHPYEEPAIDVYPLQDARAEVGIGRFGRLPKPVRVAALIATIKEKLGVSHVRVAGETARAVERVGIVGGTGGRYWKDAARQDCQLFLTGEVSHHDAMDAASAGLVVVDAGHAGTEASAIPALAKRLRTLCPTVRFQAVRASGPFSVR